MRLALIQFKSSTDPEENFRRARELVLEARGGDIIVLPEAFMFPFGSDISGVNTEEVVERLSNLAKEADSILVGGTIPEITKEGIYNTSYVFDRNGKKLGKHRKVYLYDVSLPGVNTNESEYYKPGNKATVVKTPFGKIGILVCFDIRFPHLFIECAKKGAHTIIIPAAFSKKTGKAHWELLVRARAIDSQCYIVGCSAAQNDEMSFPTYGHSIISSPYGVVEAKVDSNEQILFYDYRPEEVRVFRKMLPVLSKNNERILSKNNERN